MNTWKWIPSLPYTSSTAAAPQRYCPMCAAPEHGSAACKPKYWTFLEREAGATAPINVLLEWHYEGGIPCTYPTY